MESFVTIAESMVRWMIYREEGKPIKERNEYYAEEAWRGEN
jgi:hypothetical protein